MPVSHLTTLIMSQISFLAYFFVVCAATIVMVPMIMIMAVCATATILIVVF